VIRQTVDSWLSEENLKLVREEVARRNKDPNCKAVWTDDALISIWAGYGVMTRINDLREEAKHKEKKS